MGLDQYAYATRFHPNRPVDFVGADEGDQEPLAYWRKHPNLHGWMERLYRAKGGAESQFNCAPVVVTAEDLDALERAVKAGKLPHTTGYFFGESHEEYRARDLAFIEEARKRIADGFTVYYSSWW